MAKLSIGMLEAGRDAMFVLRVGSRRQLALECGTEIKRGKSGDTFFKKTLQRGNGGKKEVSKTFLPSLPLCKKKEF